MVCNNCYHEGGAEYVAGNKHCQHHFEECLLVTIRVRNWEIFGKYGVGHPVSKRKNKLLFFLSWSRGYLYH